MSKNKISSKRWRARKIYWVTFIVHWNYLWLFLKSWIFGRKYLDKRINKLHVKSALQLRKTFTELQGLFIKIGQLVSIMSSFLPEELRKPLEDFQDKAPARPIEEIRQSIQNELGDSIENLFEHFETTPLASASIGQVHRARLKDGTEVVVKVQHQHIAKIAAIDLDLFERVMKIVSRIFRIKGLNHVAEQINQMIEEELDYKKEGENMGKIKENLKSLKFISIPTTYADYCTSKILVSKFYEGAKINNLEQLDKWGLDKTLLAKQLLQLCSQMALVDGLYHADPHPGNILITQTGQMILLDFGAVSIVHPRMKTGLAKLVEGAAKGDTEEIVEALKFMDFVSKGDGAFRFAEKLIGFVQDFFQNEVQMESLSFKDIHIQPGNVNFGELLELFSFRELTNAFQVPKDYILLNRMILLASGISTELAPALNPLDVVRPYLRKFVMGDTRNLPKFLLDFAKNNLTNLITLPFELRKVLHKIKRGEMEVQIRDSNIRANLYYYLGQQFIFTFLLLFGFGLSYYTYQNGDLSLQKWFFWANIILVFLWVRVGVLGRRVRKKLN